VGALRNPVAVIKVHDICAIVVTFDDTPVETVPFLPTCLDRLAVGKLAPGLGSLQVIWQPFEEEDTVHTVFLGLVRGRDLVFNVDDLALFGRLEQFEFLPRLLRALTLRLGIVAQLFLVPLMEINNCIANLRYIAFVDILGGSRSH